MVNINIMETGAIERLLKPQGLATDFSLVTDIRRPAKHTCNQVWFHDISEIFEVFLCYNKDLAFVYPPGSGKSTVAKIFQEFADCNTRTLHSSFQSYFEKCKLKTEKKELFEEFYRKCNVVLISFKDVYLGDTTLYSAKEIKEQYTNMMSAIANNAWSQPEVFNKYYLDVESAALSKDPSSYFCSLSMLYSRLSTCKIDKKYQKGFILYDSIDCMYNEIAKISSFELRKELLSDFTRLFNLNTRNVKSIFFGVSPFFFTDYLKLGAGMFSIVPSASNMYTYNDEERLRLRRYHDIALNTFSYSEDDIRKTCEDINECCETDESFKKIEIDKMIALCKEIGEYEVDGVKIMNPYLVVSYIWSFINREPYTLDVSPLSLWYKYDCTISTSITTTYGCEMLQELQDVVNKPTIVKNFDMFASFSSIMGESVLPLFVHGGYLSVNSTSMSSNEGGEKHFELKVANKSMKIILEYSLNVLWKQWWYLRTLKYDQSSSTSTSRAKRKRK
ncbi:uncharacterized protein LOC135831183 [Planococcus citri]|uniref:uncharacterized protein LOC135831183 n=1 Tax=Planococcus citri TaxID=170843 RepID=UPI0031FA0C2F